MTESSELLVERPHDGVVLFRINRPAQRNALTVALRDLIAKRFNEFNADPTVRCVVLTGDEKSFASGGDIAELNARTPVDVAFNSSKEPWRAMRAFEKPIIGAVRGFALGGGFEVAMACDILVVGRNAKVGQPEIKIGISPGSGGVQRFARAVGKYRAMRWLLTGDILSGQTAFEIGLASEVVDDAEVVDRALALARAIAALPPLSEIATKEAVLNGFDAALATGLRLENLAFQLLFSTEDRTEGMKAFQERRAPQFKGR